MTKKISPEAIACIAKHGTCSPHWEPYVGIYLAQECERLRTALSSISQDEFGNQYLTERMSEAEYDGDEYAGDYWRVVNIARQAISYCALEPEVSKS